MKFIGIFQLDKLSTRMQIIKSTPKLPLSHWINKRFLYLLCILSLNLQLVSVDTVAQYSKLLDFGSKGGSYPNASLISVGSFLYGMTSEGGSSNFGTIFKIKPDGTGYTKLLDFKGASNGSRPYGSLFSDGTFLYGMTAYGGANDLGTIFKIKFDGTGYTKLTDFDGAIKGSYPNGDLISDGTFLYGMAYSGGAFNFGTLFRIKPDGTSFSTLLEFKGTTNGSSPAGSLILEGSFLYGMTSAGGANDIGTLFKIMPDGTGYVNLLDFDGSTNGSYPIGSVFSDGTFLYGLTSAGGANDDGVIFKIKPDGTSFTNLHDFQGSFDGSRPYGSLISDGTFLYGMTNYYGNDDYGTIFKIEKDGTGFVNMLDFDGSTTGGSPYGSLLSDGTFLYGMTQYGGASDLGLVFKIKFDGSGYDKLHEFYTSGNSPNGSLISDGTFLYGMTSGGGAFDYGTIFKVKPDGSEYTNLFDFDNSGSGAYPQGSLFFDGTFLYGMTNSGGANNYGTIFKINTDGTGYITLRDFNGSDGDTAYGSLISDGTFLYGMTSEGGSDSGTIFKIKPDGSGFVTLSEFESPGAGFHPTGDLLLNGTTLYGMTERGGANASGTIFKMETDGTSYTTLFDFDGGSTGGGPNGSLISDGTFLYGMTTAGGVGSGTVFKIMPDGTGYLRLQNFSGFDVFDGGNPYGSLVFDGTTLYGLTSIGGEHNLGTIFKIMPDGSDYTKLLDFDGPTNGNNPQGSLVKFGSSLYGLTSQGGLNGNVGGTLFRYGLNGSCPDVASITATNTELTASSGDSYQWYYFGDPISGATNQSLNYNMLEYGVYAVEVTTIGCTATATFEYLITGLEQEPKLAIQVFPNPVKENVFVAVPETGYALKMTDLLGRVVLEQPAQKGLNELKTDGLTSGLYYLVAKSHDDVIVIKVQKQ